MRKTKTQKEKKEEKIEIVEEKQSQLKNMSGKTQEISAIGITRFKVDLEKGLTDEQVQTRVEQGLVNKVKTGSKKSILGIIITNVFTFFNMINFAIAIWLISVGAFSSLFFMVVISSNIIIGLVQEIRAKIMIDKLSLLSSATAIVIRNGEKREIQVNELVLDDIIVLEAGKQILADSIVKEGIIEVNESLLTGESDALVKKVGSSLFSGSYVVSGTCKAKVEKVGKDNYIEKLSSQAKIYNKPKSELLKSLKIIIGTVSVLIVPISCFMFVIQMGASSGTATDFAGAFARMGDIIMGKFSSDSVEFQQYASAVVKTSTSIINMIPSGLFLSTSMTLAVGVIKLAKHKTLVQELYCIEMLARVNVLCLDKTGTITDGTMSVKGVEMLKNPTDLSMKQIVSMMQNSLNDKNMTSVALEQEFGKGRKVKAKHIIPFSSVRKFSAVSYEKYGTFLLGAPEFILKKEYSTISADVEKHTKKGYRVLLVAHDNKVITKDSELKNVKPTPVGLILIEDTIREDALETIQYFKNSGVTLKIISGDSPLTAAMVAKRAGLEKTENYISMEKISDDKIPEIINKYTVFGRVSPNQKKLLIQELKKQGNTVAMTGDGVNDILALKEADCSIAMASGSEAARNASHLVLLDSNFSSMPRVVQEGRRVINNIQRVATLFLTKTIFSFILSAIIIYANYVLNAPLAYPIELKQMNVIGVLAIGIPSFFLALETNNNQIKGKFILNVLKNALPGALVIILNFLVILFLQDSLVIGQSVLPTMSLVVTCHTFFMVLNRVCKPYNHYRRALYVSMVLAFLGCLFIPEISAFLELVKLDVPQILLVLLLVVLANPILEFLIGLPAKISSFIKEKMHFKRIKIILVEKEEKKKAVKT